MYFGFMDVISSRSDQQHVSASHVAILGVVTTKQLNYIHKTKMRMSVR